MLSPHSLLGGRERKEKKKIRAKTPSTPSHPIRGEPSPPKCKKKTVAPTPQKPAKRCTSPQVPPPRAGCKMHARLLRPPPPP
ncbi:hypothetical protein B0T18DRAFT_419404, partial [Schizothecium vesticola]